MYKLVQGKLGELEDLLNAAVKEGYTELFREFPAPFILDATTGVPSPVDVYSFMMKKPTPPLLDENFMSGFTDSMRGAMVALGLGDRLPPPGGKAPVFELIKKERDPSLDDFLPISDDH
jgi:hypothetical protein